MRILVAFSVLSLTLAACGGTATTTETTLPVAADLPATTTTSPPTTTTRHSINPTPRRRIHPRGPSPSSPLSDEARYDHFVRTDTITVGQASSEREIDIDIHAPEEIGPWPVVVTVHGGAWFAGDRTTIGALADGLADRKVVVFNTSYSTISRGGMFPGMVDDIACAVQHARINAGEFTSTPRLVTIVGHSAGAHLASLVAYAPAEFGRACPDGPMQGPDAFVGLAGPYDISGLDFLLTPMFGGSIDETPELWEAANPFTWIADSPDIPTLLLHGEEDRVAPIEFSEDIDSALREAGRDVRFEVLFNRGHSDASAPQVVGDRIVRFLEEVAAG